MSYLRGAFTQYLLGTNIFNWFSLLIRSGFRINLRSIPKVFLITLSTIINFPVFILEEYIYQTRIRNVEIEKNPVFVIGHWRSGTTYLVNLLSRDKQFAYFNIIETFFPSTFLSNYPILKAIAWLLLPKTRPMDKVKLDFQSPQEEEFSIANMSTDSISHISVFPRDRNKYMKYGLFQNLTKQEKKNWKKKYVALMKKMTYKYDGKALLLKSPTNTCKINEILDIFPEAKFVHIYRNPYKVCTSTFRMYKSLFPLFSLQGNISDEEALDFQLNLYEEFWRKFLNDKAIIPKENLIEIKYEDFIKSPMEHVEMIYEKLSLPNLQETRLNFERYIDDQKSFNPNKHTVSKDIKEFLNNNCKFVFDEYEYEIIS